MGKFKHGQINIIEGYNNVYDTREKRNGGGVSIYIDLRIAFKKRLDLQLDKSHFESCFIEVDKSIFQCKSNVIIAAVYKPPNISTKIFTENMEKILNIIHKENKYAYFLGDYNINTLNELLCKSSLIHDFINLMPSYSYNKLY